MSSSTPRKRKASSLNKLSNSPQLSTGSTTDVVLAAIMPSCDRNTIKQFIRFMTRCLQSNKRTAETFSNAYRNQCAFVFGKDSRQFSLDTSMWPREVLIGRRLETSVEVPPQADRLAIAVITKVNVECENEFLQNMQNWFIKNDNVMTDVGRAMDMGVQFAFLENLGNNKFEYIAEMFVAPSPSPSELSLL